MVNKKETLWWGYLHINNEYQVKRYYDPEDLKEARSSPFVQDVLEPFMARDRPHALKKIKKLHRHENT